MLISISELILKSIALYKNNAKRFITYSFLIFVPGAFITIFSAILPILIPERFTLGIIGASYIIYILLAIILSFVSFWFSLAFIRVITKNYNGTAVGTMGEEIHEAKAIFWPSFWTYILTGLAVFGGMLLLVIPGIIFGLWFAFSIYVTAIDNKRPIQAMKTSKQLVDGRWWKVFWRILIPSLVFGIAIIIIQYIITLPLEYILENTNPQTLLYVTWGVLATLIISLCMLFLTPLITSVYIILYTELKKHPLQKETPPATLAK
jgi:hypothetical protein